MLRHQQLLRFAHVQNVDIKAKFEPKKNFYIMKEKERIGISRVNDEESVFGEFDTLKTE